MTGSGLLNTQGLLCQPQNILEVLDYELVPPYSEERKAAARKYAKEHGLHAVRQEQDIA